jgi:hypothetical protein
VCGLVSDNAVQNTTLRIAIPPAMNTYTTVMSVNGWLTILSRVDSRFSTNKTWLSYKEGFGNATSNFWLGLERIYQLTNGATDRQQIYRLRLEVQSNATGRYVGNSKNPSRRRCKKKTREVFTRSKRLHTYFINYC